MKAQKEPTAGRSEPRWGAARRVGAAEAARRWIAREIHDDFSQRLAGLALALRVVRKRLPDDDPNRLELDAIAGGVAELGEDLRRLSHDLHLAALERSGLVEALRDHCAEVERRSGLVVGLSLHDADGPWPPEIALGLYRVAQEALANVVRHAGARRAQVTLRSAAGEARLTIADDGGGFDVELALRGAGLGLASIDERARLLGGQVRIASAPGSGTEVEVRVPRPGRESALARLGRLVRQHRGFVTAAALVMLALAAGLAAITIQARGTGSSPKIK